MCRLKSHSLTEKCVWRLVWSSGCILLLLGATSFGFGMKLIEFAEKSDVTPVFAGIPMMIAGFLGLASAMCKKGWLVTGYGISCVIISMLSIHMNYRFMGKELPSLPVYRDQCRSEPKAQYHCERYIGTLALCGTAVLMLPFILAAILSCVAAKRTLKKKNCCIIWFTCSEVEPSLPTSYSTSLQRYQKRQKTNPVGLLSYNKTTSKGFVCGVPETRSTAEYLPRIPDFTDLAGRPDSPGYPASVMFEYENQDSYPSCKISKDVKTRKENYGHSKSKEQDLALFESGLPIEDSTGVAHVQRRKKANTVTHGVATSEVDLNLLEQDYLNRRSYLDEEENEKYYSRAAEEWIQKMVDNVHDSRSRLYAVSDEEELDDAPRRKESSESPDKYPRQASTDSEKEQEISTGMGSPPRSHSSDMEGNVDASVSKVSLKSKGCCTSEIQSTVYVDPDLSSEQDETYIDRRKLSIDLKPVLASRRRKFGASSPNDIEQEPNGNQDLVSQSDALKSSSQTNASTTDSQSETSITEIQSESLADIQSRSLSDCDSEKIEEINAVSDIEYFGNKDLTPHGIVTPKEQAFPNGSLHFEFEKAAPTEHARKNWVEFEGAPEDRQKLLKGRMGLKEYEELTSYLM